MTTRPLLALAIVPALLSGCVATSYESRTWGEPSGGYGQSSWTRYGHVESIRENIQRQQGDPGAGAVAGAIIGGLIGNSLGQGNPASTVVGAIGGAAVGASASQGSAEARSYEVFVRFDDGGLERFVYPGALPFRVGDRVVLSDQGLSRY